MRNTKISVERCMDCDDLLAAISKHLIELPEEEKEATKLALAVQIVRGFLIDFGTTMQEGREPYDAMVAAVQGKRPL